MPKACTPDDDTLEFARKLTAAGMDRRVAEDVVLAIAETLASAEMSTLATKKDMALLKGDLAKFKSDLFRFMAIQTVVTIGAIVTLKELLL